MSPADEARIADLAATIVVVVTPPLITYFVLGITSVPWWAQVIDWALGWIVGSRVGKHIYAERMREESA